MANNAPRHSDASGNPNGVVDCAGKAQRPELSGFRPHA